MDTNRPSAGAATGADKVAECTCKPLGNESGSLSDVTRKWVSVTPSRLWLKLRSKPFIKSFVEDLHPGTSKRTRENTVLNQKLVPTSCEHCDTRTTADECSSSSSTSLSTEPSALEKRVSFHDTVQEFSHKHDSAGEHSLRFTPRRVALAPRLTRSWPTFADATAPQSAAGKWLLGGRTAQEQ